MIAMLARLTDEGVAAGETALCAHCLPTADLDFFDAPDCVTEHVDCTGNEVLACGACGAIA